MVDSWIVLPVLLAQEFYQDGDGGQCKPVRWTSCFTHDTQVPAAAPVDAEGKLSEHSLLVCVSFRS